MTIALAAAVGLAIGIVVAVGTEVPLAPELGALGGALIGWLLSRHSTSDRDR